MVWAVCGEPSGVAHVFAVAVVGGDEELAAEFEGLARRRALTPASIVSHGLDRGLDDAGVADHVGVGEVEDDEVVVLEFARRPSR